MHWESAFASSGRQKYPPSLQVELGGPPTAFAQVKLLLWCYSKTAQGSGNGEQTPGQRDAPKSSGLSQSTEGLPGVPHLYPTQNGRGGVILS